VARTEITVTVMDIVLRGRLLDVHEQIAFQDVFAFFVLLRVLECKIVFPSDNVLALAAQDITDDVITRSHRAFTGFTFDNVHNFLEEIRSSVLAIKCSRNHGMNSG